MNIIIGGNSFCTTLIRAIYPWYECAILQWYECAIPPQQLTKWRVLKTKLSQMIEISRTVSTALLMNFLFILEPIRKILRQVRNILNGYKPALLRSDFHIRQEFTDRYLAI